MTRLVDEVLSAYFRRYGDAEKAYQQDPLTHAHVQWLNRTITMMDIAMADEGVPEETRRRVLRMVVYGSAGDPNAALDRMADREEQIMRLSAQPDLCPPAYKLKR